MFGEDVGEWGTSGVAHRWRAADVDVTVSSEQAPYERALLADPVLDILAPTRPVAGRRHVNVIKHPFGREPPDFVPVDIVEAARADAVEQCRFCERDARALERQPFPEERPHRGESGAD